MLRVQARPTSRAARPKPSPSIPGKKIAGASLQTLSKGALYDPLFAENAQPQPGPRTALGPPTFVVDAAGSVPEVVG